MLSSDIRDVTVRSNDGNGNEIITKAITLGLTTK